MAGKIKLQQALQNETYFWLLLQLEKKSFI
jgi:hypothetical protein